MHSLQLADCSWEVEKDHEKCSLCVSNKELSINQRRSAPEGIKNSGRRGAQQYFGLFPIPINGIYFGQPVPSPFSYYPQLRPFPRQFTTYQDTFRTSSPVLRSDALEFHPGVNIRIAPVRVDDARNIIMACDSVDGAEEEVIGSNPESANTKNSRGFYASYLAKSENIASQEWRELDVSREPDFAKINSDDSGTRRGRQLKKKPSPLKELTGLIEKHSSLIEKPILDQIDGSSVKNPMNKITELLGNGIDRLQIAETLKPSLLENRTEIRGNLVEKPILVKVETSTESITSEEECTGVALYVGPETTSTNVLAVTTRLTPVLWTDALGSLKLIAEFTKCIFDVKINEMVQENLYSMARNFRNGGELIVLLNQLGIITSEEKRTIKDLHSELEQTVAALCKAVFKKNDEKEIQKLLQVLLFVESQEIADKMEETLRAVACWKSQ